MQAVLARRATEAETNLDNVADLEASSAGTDQDASSAGIDQDASAGVGVK